MTLNLLDIVHCMQIVNTWMAALVKVGDVPEVLQDDHDLSGDEHTQHPAVLQEDDLSEAHSEDDHTQHPAVLQEDDLSEAHSEDEGSEDEHTQHPAV